ncbi:endolytic transglycosylase MltG [Streptomyces sp. NL15-2K]|uniref:endolytic transglycosylase MltG n=1 Tax=Streptomyces sp. NL15-2K TaxID=376149 RepID=UPI000F562442|nr:MULTISPECIES: endolytic transglycosylase MltG [Actinomycetes]WKX07647.1 endolytic transglycosylase MltG [Kutzneria buriramensis]
MTDYGRGEGSEPWHPEDPLYGDGGWGGQQAQEGQQSPYGGQPQHYREQPQYGDWGNGQQAAYGQAQQHYQQQHQQQYGEQQYNQQQYNQQYDQQYDQQQYGAQPQQQYDNGDWATGTHSHVQYADPSDPYGQQGMAYGGQQPDHYGTPDAYPPPEPPSRRRAEPEPRTDWDPGPDQGEHAFFAGGGDDDDSDDEAGDQGGRGDRRGRGGKEKKRRSGCACLVVMLVIGGGVGGVGYLGYQYYQDRFAPAPDFAGEGTSQIVTVEIPKGAGGYDIGRRLKAAGVVKSVDAFVSAQSQNADGNKIQAGAYLLKKQMSAESAVAMMLDPTSQNNVLVKEGERNIAVYKTIDEKLELPSGSTKKVAEKKYKSLGLPSWADDNSEIKDPLEGFLYPGTYPAAKGMKPEAVLKEMVAQASRKYDAFGVEAKAKALKLKSPLQVVTVASLVQAEGKTSEDYRKMAEVVYNRLDIANPETYGLLQFDSTFNYLKNESNIDISESEINNNKDPYNTYTQKGLPPGPIGNPGDVAMKATLDPTKDGWFYFVAVDGVSKTEFAKTHAEFQRLKNKFNESSGGS